MLPPVKMRLGILLLVFICTLVAIPFKHEIKDFVRPYTLRLRGLETVDSRVRALQESVGGRLEPAFSQAEISYPPGPITLLAFKEEMRLEIWAGGQLVKVYPILGASGKAGPKLREGDLQVPEGFYGIESLNPNSSFHLALRLDYPNEHDRKRAKQDGRKNLGGDIMIHGGTASIGCLAIGDPAIEEIFVLAAQTELDEIEVIIAPRDFRTLDFESSDFEQVAWTGELYRKLSLALCRFKLDDK